MLQQDALQTPFLRRMEERSVLGAFQTRQQAASILSRAEWQQPPSARVWIPTLEWRLCIRAVGASEGFGPSGPATDHRRRLYALPAPTNSRQTFRNALPTRSTSPDSRKSGLVRAPGLRE